MLTLLVVVSLPMHCTNNHLAWLNCYLHISLAALLLPGTCINLLSNCSFTKTLLTVRQYNILNDVHLYYWEEEEILKFECLLFIFIYSGNSIIGMNYILYRQTNVKLCFLFISVYRCMQCADMCVFYILVCITKKLFLHFCTVIQVLIIAEHYYNAAYNNKLLYDC